MAAELINEILKAETTAKLEEDSARQKAEELLEYARKKAEEYRKTKIAEAEREADIIIQMAESQAVEKDKEANRMANLRKKTVIRETMKRYDMAITLIINTLTL